MTQFPPSISIGHDNYEEANDWANSSSFDHDNSGLYLGGAADDDDASHYTSITLQLQSSAFKQAAYVKSYRSVQAAVPLEVKEAMLVSSRCREGEACRNSQRVGRRQGSKGAKL